MKRTDPDIIPTEGIFAVAYHITRHGNITTEKAAELAGCTLNNVRILLNIASRVTPITRSAPGRWIVTDVAGQFAQAEAAPLLRTLREELARSFATPRRPELGAAQHARRDKMS